MRLIIFLFLFLLPSIAIAAPDIQSIAGTPSHGQSITLSGADFGTRTDNGGSEDYLCARFDDFEDDDLIGWSFVGDGSSWETVSTGQRTNSTYSAHKKNESQNDRMYISQGGSNTITHYYVSFWIYLAADYPVAKTNDKFFRAGSTPIQHAGGYPNIVWSDSSASAVNSRLIIEFEADGGSFEADTGGEFSKATWHFIEVEWALPESVGSTDDYAKVFINGSQENDLPHTGGLWWEDEYMTRDPFISIGTWFNTANGGIGSGWFYDDVYIDYTRARVVLGNNSVYASCTYFEAQVPTAWSASSTTIDFNQGSFASEDTAYLYLIDENGTVSNSFEVTIGEAQASTVNIQGGSCGGCAIN